VGRATDKVNCCWQDPDGMATAAHGPPNSLYVRLKTPAVTYDTMFSEEGKRLAVKYMAA